MTNKQTKLKELLARLNTLQNKEVLPEDGIDSLMKDEISNLATKLADNPTIKILKKFSTELSQFKKDFDLSSIHSAIKELGTENENNTKIQISEFESKLKEIKNSIPKIESNKPFDPTPLAKDILKLREDFTTKKDFDPIPLQTDLDEVRQKLETLVRQIQEDTSNVDNKREFEKKLEDLRKDLLTLINSYGGGSMNRQVLFNSTNYLKKYTDYNLIAGTNVTFTISESTVNKRVNLTISASGGGGGAGITRVITSVAISTAAGSASATDYVYLCAGTLTITLPTAVGNSNLYTIKNIGSGVVTIATTGAETIDGSATLVMPIQFTSVDLISNNSGDWAIT